MHTRHRLGALALAAATLTAGCSQGNVFSIEAGTCFDDVAEFTEEGGGEVSDVPVVDCAEPHDNEVYATFDIDGDEWPGEEAVRTAADEGCVGRFEDYVGRDYPSSRFVSQNIVPTEQTWNQAGDREVICFLHNIELAKLEGSAQGSGE